MAIGQTVFNQRLKENLGTMVSQDVVNEIINSGVTSLRSLISASELPGVIQEYSKAVTQVWVSILIFLSHDPIHNIRWSRLLTVCQQVYSGCCPGHLFRAAAWLQMHLHEKQARSDNAKG